MSTVGINGRDVRPSPPFIDVAVIVATFNRVHHLRRALGSLQGVTIPSRVTLEVIVVDNNSTDNTPDLVNDFTKAANVRFRYLSEPRQGKAFALNTAIQATSAHILAFTDDDCLVDAKWIEAMVTAFRGDQSLEGLAGRVELYDPTDRPVCIQTDPNPKMCSPSTSLSIMGCNMALKRRVFDDVGMFDPMFGPGHVAGEDIDLFYRAQRKGLKFMYLTRNARVPQSRTAYR